MEERLERVERILENQSLSDIVLQVQHLQQEVQQLHGDLEVQQHNLDALGRRQRELYSDLDSRIGHGQGSGQGEPTGGGTPVPVQPAPEPAAPAQVAAPTAVPPGDPAKELPAYQHAFDLLKRGSYAESITAFRDFLAAYPNGTYSDNAQYWLGEASYVTRDFDTAQTEFKRVLEQYPSSAKVPGAMLKLGFIQHEKGQIGKAREILGELIRRFPDSTEARLAQQRMDLLRRDGR
jgi:tol-pal system protein YbgF